MNSWQSATTEVEPGHHGLQAVEADDPDLGVRQLAAVVRVAVGLPEAHAVQVHLAVASQADPQIVRVRHRPVRVPLIVAVTIAVMIVLVPARNVLLVVVTDVAWILAPSQTVLAVLHLARGLRIVAVMIGRAALHRVRVIPIAVTAAVATTVVVMTGLVPALLVRVAAVMTEAVMIALVVHHRVRVIPIVVTAAAATIVGVTIGHARTTRIDRIRAVVMTEAAMTGLDLLLRVPMIAMTAVATRVQGLIVHAVLRPARATQIDRIRAVVMTEAAMTGLDLLLRVPVARVKIVIAMSVRAHRLLALDIPIVVTSVVMIDPHALQIAQLPVVRAICVRSAMIAVRAHQCVVAMTAIRFVIPEFQTTSRQRILIAGC